MKLQRFEEAFSEKKDLPEEIVPAEGMTLTFEIKLVKIAEGKKVRDSSNAS